MNNTTVVRVPIDQKFWDDLRKAAAAHLQAQVNHRRLVVLYQSSAFEGYAAAQYRIAAMRDARLECNRCEEAELNAITALVNAERNLS